MEVSVSNSSHEMQELDLEDPTTPLTLKPTKIVGEKNGVNGKGKGKGKTTTLEMVKDPQCNDDGTLRVLIYSTCYNIVDGYVLSIYLFGFQCIYFMNRDEIGIVHNFSRLV